MNNTEKKHFTYTHWLKIDANNELEKLKQLVKYINKYDCSMTVFYYNHNPKKKKIVKLECNQSYEDLDLEVNSLSSTSIKRLKHKPFNISVNNKKVEAIFWQKFADSFNQNKTLKKEKSFVHRYQSKLEKFAELCGDWDYRNNVDMTEPHLACIDIDQEKILVTCEKFSADLDKYVFCNGGTIENPLLVNKFKKLNLSNQEDVLAFISEIDNLLDWNKVDEKLENAKYEEYRVDKPYIFPCKKLGDGWFWYRYSDGSGHLSSPEGKVYMAHNLRTYEYKATEDDRYKIFPLECIRGFNGIKFKPFEYMEDEMLNYVLPNEEKNKVVDTLNDMEL